MADWPAVTIARYSRTSPRDHPGRARSTVHCAVTHGTRRRPKIIGMADHTEGHGRGRHRHRQDRETSARDRETEIGQGLGIPDPIGTAEHELGPGPGHGGGMLSEEDVDKLGRMAHDVRVDVRVLADAMHRVAGADPVAREAALEAISSPSDPHLESGPDGPHRAVHLSRVAHIDARNARFGYRSAGQGHPLLMIMGGGGVMATWDPALVERLALAGRRVTVFDNRGIGTSSPLGDPEALTIASMADDVIAILDALGIDTADLLGWAMGGYIAQEVALRAPERVSALMLAATDAGGPEALVADARAKEWGPAESTDAELARLSFPDDEDGAAAARAWIERVASQPGATSEWFRVPRETLVAQRVAEGPGWASEHGGTRARLGAITAPTLVLTGAEDAVVPPSDSAVLAEGIPDAKARTYAHAGHAFLFQAPERVASDIVGFLRAR